MASFFTWILLAGFVLFPGTFTSLQEANGEGLGRVGGAILGSISHLPLQVMFVSLAGHYVTDLSVLTLTDSYLHGSAPVLVPLEWHIYGTDGMQITSG